MTPESRSVFSHNTPQSAAARLSIAIINNSLYRKKSQLRKQIKHLLCLDLRLIRYYKIFWIAKRQVVMEARMPQKGSGGRQKFHLRSGLMFHVSDFTPQETVKMRFEISNQWLTFSFRLAADGYVKFLTANPANTDNRSFQIKCDSSVDFCRHQEGIVCFPAEHHQYHMAVQIAPTLLNTYLDGRFNRIPHDLRAILEGCDTIDFFHSMPVTPIMNLTIQNLLDCPYTGDLRTFFLESKVIELIAHKLAQIESSSSAAPASENFRSDDIEHVRFARDLLIRDLENPPRLFDLAHAAGTNHTQLNRGFQKMYGTSVFGYLRKMRLEKARHLMEEERMNVTEAAVAVGYNSLSSFSRAFSAHFGSRPLRFLKRDSSPKRC